MPLGDPGDTWPLKRESEPERSEGSLKRVVMPPPGYVMLVEGQKIKAGDLYCRGEGHSWHETRIKNGYWTEHGNYPMCRRRHNGAGEQPPPK